MVKVGKHASSIDVLFFPETKNSDRILEMKVLFHTNLVRAHSLSP